jgi:hypothetical protein
MLSTDRRMPIALAIALLLTLTLQIKTAEILIRASSPALEGR